MSAILRELINHGKLQEPEASKSVHLLALRGFCNNDDFDFDHSPVLAEFEMIDNDQDTNVYSVGLPEARLAELFGDSASFCTNRTNIERGLLASKVGLVVSEEMWSDTSVNPLDVSVEDETGRQHFHISAESLDACLVTVIGDFDEEELADGTLRLWTKK